MAVIVGKAIAGIFIWYLLSFFLGGFFVIKKTDRENMAAMRIVSGSIAIMAVLFFSSLFMKVIGGNLFMLSALAFGIALLGSAISAFLYRKSVCFPLQIKKDTSVILILALLQILLAAFFNRTDYSTLPALAEAVSCYGLNQIPETGKFSVLLLASLGSLLKLHPMILQNTFAGFFLFPVFDLCFYLVGTKIFADDRKKCLWFTGAAIVFFSVGSSYDMNFSGFAGETIFQGLLFPYMVFLLMHYGEKPFTAVANRVRKLAAARKKEGREQKEEQKEEEDFMNTKKGKLLFAGYIILIPVILGLLFSVYKLNSKINSVYTITQEIKDAMGAPEEEKEIDSEHETEPEAGVSENQTKNYTLDCFSEADGQSFITFDTGSSEQYRLYQTDVNEDAGGLSYILEKPEGGLVVIDGGYYADGTRLHDFITSHGGKVDAWFLTHPHYDHIGAFLYCMTEGKEGITVSNVYYSPFDDDFIENSEAIDTKTEYEALDLTDFEKLRLGEENASTNFISLNAGDTAATDGISALCLSSYDASVDDVNDNSLVLKFTIHGVSMMITGDITEKTVDRMVEKLGTDPSIWNVDFLQIPHHGYTGGGDTLYELTQPQFALLDCSTAEYTGDVLGIQSETVARLHDKGIGLVKRFEGTNVVLIQ